MLSIRIRTEARKDSTNREQAPNRAGLNVDKRQSGATAASLCFRLIHFMEKNRAVILVARRKPCSRADSHQCDRPDLPVAVSSTK